LKTFFAAIIVVIVAAVAVAYLVINLGLIPASADSGPLLLESWAADVSLNATLARNAPKEPNPIPLTDENLIAGIKLYGEHCAICHGTSKGISSASPVALGLYPKPPQLASDGVEDDPEGYSFWKVKHGIRWTGMPSWKGKLSDPEIWTLALFLKHMDNLPPQARSAWQQIKN
jgi:thiosulfate dehydrogenase